MNTGKLYLDYKIIFMLFLAIAIPAVSVFGQIKEQLPYREIVDYPEKYTAGTVASRMVDGLGFRYFWTTEDLKINNLTYKPESGARTIQETLNHIYQLTQVLCKMVKVDSKDLNIEENEISFAELRRSTLLNIQLASTKLLSSNAKDLEGYNLKTSSGSDIPFWNLLNGPIEDAVWHCGQVVYLRRLAGNPISSDVSFFAGKIRSTQ